MPSPGINLFHPELAPPTVGNPQEETPPADAPQQPPGETTPPQEPVLLAGKYRTVEELEAAYSNSFNELGRIREENRRALDEERRRTDMLFAQRQPPGQQPRIADRLAEFGIPVDVFRDAVREEATAISRAEIAQTLTPMTESFRARGELERQIPDFVEVERKAANFIGADPSLTQRYSRLYQTDPQTAMEWAILKYRETNPPPAPKDGTRVSAAPPTTDAAVPSGRGGGERQAPPDTARLDELEKAKRYYEHYKDSGPYLRARLRDVIPDSHFKE